MEQIDTVESHTYTKPVEAAEYVPVQKDDTLPESVHLEKTMPYVEPIITIQTIAEKIQESVVGEKITITVEPATDVCESKPTRELYVHWLQLEEEERFLRVQDCRRFRKIGLSDADIQKELDSVG